jgi:spoIIIJ-associated protein
MTEDRTTVEVNAPTVDEAISKGISELGVSEDAVQKEILDAGSRGIFGIGSRQARVRLTVVRAAPAVVPSAPPVPEKITPPERVVEAVAPPQETQASVPAQVKTQVPVQPKPRPASQAAPKVDAAQAFATEENEDLKKAAGTVRDLIERMQVTAAVTARFVDSPESKFGDKKDEQTILVEIHGNDLSILIGRKSETLNALQYISSLIVSKELGRWITLQIDVEGYRQRRERVLRQIARRMADQVVATGKRQSLEPMPASERRVIHLELRDHPSVITESVGEEPNRKVTISPKR